MLEVHPPHQTPHSWRDFFIHIATIVVGLLIAVSLEQSVEWVHHRDEVAQTRNELEHERARNARISAVLLAEYRRVTPRLIDNLRVFQYLRAHPGAPRREWPAQLSWASLSITYLHSAWDTAQQGKVLPLMPEHEVQQYNEIYSRLQIANESYEELRAAITKAQRYGFRTPDPSAMSPAQIDTELALIEDVLAAHLFHGGVGRAMQTRFADFRGPTREELAAFTPVPTSQAERDEIKVLFEQIQKIKDEAE